MTRTRTRTVGTLEMAAPLMGHNNPPVDYSAGIATAILSADQADAKSRTVAQVLAFHLKAMMEDEKFGRIDFKPEAFLSTSATDHRKHVLKAIDGRVKDLQPNVRGWNATDDAFIASAKARVHRSMTLLASVLVVGGKLTEKGALVDPSRLLPASTDKIKVDGWHPSVEARIKRMDLVGLLPLDGSSLEAMASDLTGKARNGVAKCSVKLTNDAIVKIAGVMVGKVTKKRGTKCATETPKAETFQSANDAFRKFAETARNANGGAPLNDNGMVRELASSVIAALEAIGLASYAGNNPVLTLESNGVASLTDLAERLDMLSKLDLIDH
jgi:hypothetical protein